MEVTFGKDRYHLQREMEFWCRENIGPGCWTSGTPKTWEGMDGNVWTIHSMFGNTTFCFKEQKHFNWFVLRWM